jgi:predicted TIM-barrel fold metal-dependent hydrolase
MFSTDFPHEIGPADIIRELGALQTRGDLTDAQRKGVLEDNARRFYRL